ncbi:MAG: sulfate ABC transporter permease subunit CysT [Firmicutes bacterium]|nr:sulfate ABC transporter permease subunit CysT [Bacillota bacterium]
MEGGRVRFKKRSILPGFGLSMGFTIFYLSLIVLIPLTILILRSFSINWAKFWGTIASPRLIASYCLSFGASFLAALTNAFFGFIAAWALSRYKFPGRRIIDALVDLPFAMPTAVAGISLTTLYAESGWIGRFLAPLGIKAAFTPVGVWIALTFIGLPFVVRTLQPIIQGLDPEVEEAAANLGASRWKTFTKVILPVLWPGWLTGFALAFARGLGEYGSVVFISGNMPFRTEITPFLIVSKLEQYDYAGATAIAVVMLLASFILLFGINLFQWRSMKHQRL